MGSSTQWEKDKIPCPLLQVPCRYKNAFEVIQHHCTFTKCISFLQRHTKHVSNIPSTHHRLRDTTQRYRAPSPTWRSCTLRPAHPLSIRKWATLPFTFRPPQALDTAWFSSSAVPPTPTRGTRIQSQNHHVGIRIFGVYLEQKLWNEWEFTGRLWRPMLVVGLYPTSCHCRWLAEVK